MYTVLFWLMNIICNSCQNGRSSLEKTDADFTIVVNQEIG